MCVYSICIISRFHQWCSLYSTQSAEEEWGISQFSCYPCSWLWNCKGPFCDKISTGRKPAEPRSHPRNADVWRKALEQLSSTNWGNQFWLWDSHSSLSIQHVVRLMHKYWGLGRYSLRFLYNVSFWEGFLSRPSLL